MIMPEHNQRILNDAQMEEVRKKPELDPQALAEISQVLAQSLEDCSPITLKLFDEYEDSSIHGIVIGVDQELKQIKFLYDDELAWIKLGDIVAAES